MDKFMRIVSIHVCMETHQNERLIFKNKQGQAARP